MPPGPNKIYTALFTRVVDRIALLTGLNNAGFAIQLEDVVLCGPDKSEQLMIHFRDGHVGRAAVNAVNEMTLNGKKIWAGGARQEYQVDAFDPRGPTPIGQRPEIADIQRCVTEASVKPTFKDKGKAIEKRPHEAEGLYQESEYGKRRRVGKNTGADPIGRKPAQQPVDPDPEEDLNQEDSDTPLEWSESDRE